MVHPTVEKSLENQTQYSDERDRRRDGGRIGGGGGSYEFRDTFGGEEDEGSLTGDDYKNTWECQGYPGYTQSRVSDVKGSRQSSCSSRNSTESTRLSKDEKLARESGITFSIHEIVGLPMDEFNDLLSQHDLTEEQLNLCRDIRRRGKNKVAAQNCRKRKIDQVEELQTKLQLARERQMQLKEMKKRAEDKYNQKASICNNKVDEILRKNNRDPRKYTIQRINGELAIVPLPPNGMEPEDSLRAKKSCYNSWSGNNSMPNNASHNIQHHIYPEPYYNFY